MFEVLLVVIGILVLIGVMLMGRSRRGGSDPSTSVDAFHRALTAMEPGGDAQSRDRRDQRAPDEHAQDAEEGRASTDAPIDLTGGPQPAQEAERDGSGR